MVDVYEAYQILDNNWNKIALDLETIQSEGFSATRQVDPNMVVKKKDGKIHEVQNGWAGHVIPFELVQKKYLSEELQALKNDEEKLAQILSGYEEALENLTDEDKDKKFVNEDNSGFVWPEVKKAIKAGEDDPQLREILRKVLADNDQEKKLKKQIKDKSEKLHLNTKMTIEFLSDMQVMELLHEKWLLPLVDQLRALPDCIISNLISRLEKLAHKYSTTFSDVENQILSTQHQLSKMIDMLVGNEFDMRGLAELKKMFGGN